MCKWNAFAIDSLKDLCEHEHSPRENFFHPFGESEPAMPGIIATPSVADHRKILALPFGFVKTLLQAAKTPIWMTDREGRILLSNESAQQYLRPQSNSDLNELNLFNELLKVEPNQIGQRIDLGEHEVEMDVVRGGEKIRARIQWVAEPGCLIVQLETEPPV